MHATRGIWSTTISDLECETTSGRRYARRTPKRRRALSGRVAKVVESVVN